MPEAVAIVCAPTKSPNYGIFRLTDPPGMKIVSRCKAKQAFHPHPSNEGSIYIEVQGINGHAKLLHDLRLRTIDLRH
jgi:STAM-binding protein